MRRPHKGATAIACRRWPPRSKGALPGCASPLAARRVVFIGAEVRFYQERFGIGALITLKPGPNANIDVMRGGLGNDTYVVGDFGDRVTENSAEGIDTVKTSVSVYNLPSNVENLVGTATTGQILFGNTAANTILAGDGNDRLQGEKGDDTLNGGPGNDNIFGGAGGIFGGGQKRIDQRFVEPGEGFDIVATTGHTDAESRAIGQVGGGMEIRLTPHIGWVSDFSWNFVDGPNNNFGMVRTGVNFAF